MIAQLKNVQKIMFYVETNGKTQCDSSDPKMWLTCPQRLA